MDTLSRHTRNQTTATFSRRDRHRCMPRPMRRVSQHNRAQNVLNIRIEPKSSLRRANSAHSDEKKATSMTRQTHGCSRHKSPEKHASATACRGQMTAARRQTAAQHSCSQESAKKGHLPPQNARMVLSSNMQIQAHNGNESQTRLQLAQDERSRS